MNPNSEKNHQALTQEAQRLSKEKITDLFGKDNLRAESFSVFFEEDIFYDFSRELISEDALGSLIELLEAAHYKDRISGLVSGEVVNTSENKPALHTLLREPPLRDASDPLFYSQSLIQAELEKMKTYSGLIRSGALTGISGKAIKHLIVVGIGGSYLGTKMVYEALRKAKPDIRITFLTEPAQRSIDEAIQRCPLEETLVILASKSFTTSETLMIGEAVKSVYREELGSQSIDCHFIGVSSNEKAMTGFGISAELQFFLWDWVGGRYSVWSSIGLPVAIVFGMDVFMELLRGAHQMDRHFLSAPARNNLPVLLGLVGIWNTNFMGKSSKAILSYGEGLKQFSNYCQQLVMESTGKESNKHAYFMQVAPVIWGGSGIESQHSFYQALHQSEPNTAVDFILCNAVPSDPFHEFIRANCFAQIQILLRGNGLAGDPFVHGNKASSIIVLKELSPSILGGLMACYEHSVYIQAIMANINAFDQYGVEAGKSLASELMFRDESLSIEVSHLPSLFDKKNI
jgi:glucose-6-phosphate isomerase